MKIYLLVAVLLAAVAAILAAPGSENEPIESVFQDSAEKPEYGLRVRRATCNSIILGHQSWACRAHCTALGRETGTCVRKICVCSAD